MVNTQHRCPIHIIFAKFIYSAFLLFALTQGAMTIACGDPPLARMPVFYSLSYNTGPLTAPMCELCYFSLRIFINHCHFNGQKHRILLPYTWKPEPPRGLGVSQNWSEQLKKSTETQGGDS
ncbi:hypothetical protein DFH09DRAFT_1091880 [Mycena vulgaris]|nr:hypothetical protein DFH09DRAFT_1091880 [Mycena vulgaris]